MSPRPRTTWLLALLMLLPLVATEAEAARREPPWPFRAVEKALNDARNFGASVMRRATIERRTVVQGWTPVERRAAAKPRPAGRAARRPRAVLAAAPRLPKARPLEPAAATPSALPPAETPPADADVPTTAAVRSTTTVPSTGPAGDTQTASTLKDDDPAEPAPPSATSPDEPLEEPPADTAATDPTAPAPPAEPADTPPADAVLPPPEPPADTAAVDDEEPEEILPPESGAAAIDAVAPVPRPRPDVPAHRLAMLPPEPGDETPPPARTVPPTASREDLACLARLRALGVSFSRIRPIDPGGACHVDVPLEVSSLGADVALSPKAVLNCRTTEALARWVGESVVPAARAGLDATPDAITHASTYVCRPRNNVEGAKMSEHGIANAVDVASISFKNREALDIHARGAAEPEAKFQAKIREAACNYFTTVLGPGSDASHATHFHLDMAERRGGYRICDLGDAPATARAPSNTKSE